MAANGLTEKQRLFVVAFLGAARGNATEAARLAGYRGSRVTLGAVGGENLEKPRIAEAIAEHLALTRREGIAMKQARLDSLNERWWKCWQVIEARAAEAERDPGAPAAARSGLLARREVPTRDGEIVEWAVDVGLLKEMRETEKQMAAEMGEGLAQKVDVSLRGRVTQTVRRANLSMLSDDELDRLIELSEKVEAGQVAR